MKTTSVCCLCLTIALSIPAALFAQSAPDAPQSPLRVLVLTGGHGFDEKPFYEMFKSLDGMQVDFAVADPNGTTFDDISRWNYQVIVFYHFMRKISDQGKQNLQSLCDKGTGLVVLHHALIGFDRWPQWNRIVGARYYMSDTVENGLTRPKSTYRHDVNIPVHIENSDHPICAGLDDFQILDETYGDYDIDEDNTILLTTTEPSSCRQLCWTRAFRKSPVCCLQLGHDANAWKNPNYSKLLTQAIRWAACDSQGQTQKKPLE